MLNPRFRGAALLFPAAAVLFYASAHLPASAHEAISGWAYPLECCSNRDCKEVSAKNITQRPDGYVIAETGERLGYADPRLRHSPDGVYHWCSAAGAKDGRTICLFVPPQSF
jgi:hypothetical protein